MKAYKINDQFVVFPQKNLVNEVKLEPRIMKLLCMLTENSGSLVTREKAIEEIWQGYGGGDEGLTQAISFLRKLLNDGDKKLIETVPKTGYVFHGQVEVMEEKGETLPKKQGSNKRLYIAGAIVLLLAVCILVFMFNKNPVSRAPLAPPAAVDTIEKIAPKAQEQ